MQALSSVLSCFPLRTITKFHTFRERKRLASGLAPDVVVEWAAIHVAERWTSAPRMHVIPAFNIDLLL
jgi:hypothetical protein